MTPIRLLSVLIALQFPSIAAAAEAAFIVTTAQRVHPVLLRNDRNELMQITVDVASEREFSTTSFAFRFDETDDLSDLDRVELLTSEGKADFATAVRVGEAIETKGRRDVVFPVERKFRNGLNVFWLSCRLKPAESLKPGALDRRIGVWCTAVETTRGTASPGEAQPKVRRRIGVAVRKGDDDGVHTYRIPALATSARGTLLCAYDMRRRARRDLQEDIDIGLSRSTDGGLSWDPVRVIMDMGEHDGLPQEQNGCSDPGLIVDPKTGEIFCFAVWMWGKPGKHQWRDDGSEAGYEIGKSAQMLVVRSKDDGVTWSQPENLTRKLKQEAWWLFAPSPQQGIALADGTLVMPSQGRDEKGEKFSTIMSSRDHGETWTVGAPAYSGGSECQAAELGDGSIMLNIRNDREKFRAVYVTRDLGKTWTAHATNRNTLIEPTCNASLRRIDFTENGTKRHVLLFANPHSQRARTHQTLQVSFDDGSSWPEKHHVLLDEGLGAGYPSLTQIDESHVGLVYEGSTAHVVFERFRLSGLLRK